MYKVGSQDKAMVRQIQEILLLTKDGVFGKHTEAAVMRFQSMNGLVADGIVGRKTLEYMGILDTDARSSAYFDTETGLRVELAHMPKGEYIVDDESPLINEYMFIHHTSGWNNPFNTVDGWAKDDRGRVGTEFVIGGQNIKDNGDNYDGTVIQAFPEGCQGWHLGATGSYYMARHSVGVEMCAFGYLTEAGKTYVGTQAHKDQICTLKEPFLNRTKWHMYSKKQLRALKKLIEYIAVRDSIDMSKGLQYWIEQQGPIKAFGFQQDAYEGKVKGLLTHTNVRKDKTDCFPQPELVDMILSL